MALSPGKRKLLLAAALLASLGAAAWLSLQEEEAGGEVIELISSASARSGRPEIRKQVPTLPSLAKPEHAETEAPEADLFQAHAWYVPPPPPKPAAVAELPAKPVAPPVPYTYMGKLEDAPQGTLYLLVANNKVYTVVQGEVIDRVWRVDGEDAAALHFTYVPLALTKALSKSAPANAPKQNNNQGISG